MVPDSDIHDLYLDTMARSRTSQKTSRKTGYSAQTTPSSMMGDFGFGNRGISTTASPYGFGRTTRSNGFSNFNNNMKQSWGGGNGISANRMGNFGGGSNNMFGGFGGNNGGLGAAAQARMFKKFWSEYGEDIIEMMPQAAMMNQMSNGNSFNNFQQPMFQRRNSFGNNRCNRNNVTLKTMLEYMTTGSICGQNFNTRRFGMGRL